MAKGRILIVEDDFDISNMLRIYFSGQGYDVNIAPRGGEAMTLARQQLPHLIVLDIMLPDMDGYAVCRQLRQTTRTSHIPIIFLTQKDERSDRIAGLELGADDYITKPFDIEELKLRVQNAITRSQLQNLSDPRSGLPSGRLIEDELRKIMRAADWAYMDCKIETYDPFKEVYGFVAGDEVLRFTALLIREVVDQHGTPNDFIGHPGGDNFIVIAGESNAAAIRARLKARFAEEIKTHYSFIDRERGFIITKGDNNADQQMPLMLLKVGIVTSANDFSDIREITEQAAEARRSDAE
ncbi:MAG: response regulator [Chloroflexi bacterium]|nr:response regulator [Chloroflexota bacterium]